MASTVKRYNGYAYEIFEVPGDNPFIRLYEEKYGQLQPLGEHEIDLDKIMQDLNTIATNKIDNLVKHGVH